MEKNLTFWEHLDELRSCITKIVVITLVLGVIAFFFKEKLFDIVLAPKSDDFITYRFFNRIIESLNISDNGDFIGTFSVRLINTGLAKQFMIHMSVAMYAGLLCASPYIIYQLFRFISPALYENEKRYAIRAISFSYIMFILGVLLSYFLIFPFTFRFLGTYQVSPEVENMITLQSYIDTLMMLSLMMGIVFELPILCWLFGKLGFINDKFMRHYRRHAIVIILIIAAVITPTSDIFTLSLVALPMYILYELSIYLVKRTGK